MGWAKKQERIKLSRRLSIWSKYLKNIKVSASPVLYYVLCYMEFYIVCCFLISELPFFLVLGKPFDTTQSVGYAVSNIISSIVYGSRFEYSDPEFTRMVDRASENIQLSGSPSIQVLLQFFLNKLLIWYKLFACQTLIYHFKKKYLPIFLLSKKWQDQHLCSMWLSSYSKLKKMAILIWITSKDIVVQHLSIIIFCTSILVNTGWICRWCRSLTMI